MNDTTRPDLTTFLASSVHDMKNSISMMIGTLQEIVSRTDPENDPHYNDMAHMLYETQRINGNLIQLLTLYKFDNDLYPFSPESVAIADFAREAQSHIQALLDSKRITFEADLPPDLYGDFDNDLVTGVIVHAMNNAANYTRDRIRLAVAEVDGELEFRVEDNGRGFPKMMIEEGIAAMRGTDFGTGSTGLGLYFSAVVAKMHRNHSRCGSIRLENGGPLGGGCFVLRLP